MRYRSTPIGSDSGSGGFVSRMQKQLDSRFGLADPQPQDFDGFISLARECLRSAGVSLPDRDPRQLLIRALTSSDFPKLLSNTGTKLLQQAFKVQPATYKYWMEPYQVSDFKEIDLVRIGFPGTLPHLPEGSEYKHLGVNEGKETAYILTYGGLLGFSRQLLINDDRAAFKDRSKAGGMVASRTLSRKSYMRLLNPGDLSDGKAFFHSDRGNLVEGSAELDVSLSADSLALAVKALRGQKDDSGNLLDFSPKYLLVPPALEVQAWTLCYSTSLLGQNNSGVSNIFKERYGLTPVVSPELADPALGGNDRDWYLFSDPAITPACFRMLSLTEDWPEPFIDHEMIWDNDSLEMKVRIDASVFPVNPRGCVKVNVHGD